ncbi:MAG: HmuY family protein [Gemmatimonadota bacterium]
MMRPTMGSISSTMAVLLTLALAGRAAAQEAAAYSADVSAEWVFFDLSTPEGIVEVSDPLSSDAWDIGVMNTNVSVNGGESGPAGVVAYCLCANQALGSDEIQALTAEGELADFEAVTAADIPSDPSAWDSGAISTSSWYRYNLAGQHQIWPTYDVYLLKRGDEVYKLQFTSFYSPIGLPRHVSFRAAKLAG